MTDLATRLQRGAAALRELYPSEFPIEAQMLDDAAAVVDAAVEYRRSEVHYGACVLGIRSGDVKQANDKRRRRLCELSIEVDNYHRNAREAAEAASE